MVQRTRKPSAPAPARVLPGPDTLTPTQLAAVYDLIDDDVPGAGLDDDGLPPRLLPDLPTESPSHPGDPDTRDLDWYAWCAQQVAAATDAATDATTDAATDAATLDGPLADAARAHWHWQGVFAARRAHAEDAARAAVDADRAQRHHALGVFTTWHAGADEATRAAVAQAKAEHAAITRSQQLLDALHTARAAAGVGHADQWVQLADLALLYRAAVAPPGALAGTFGIPALPAVGLKAAVDAVLADDLADLADEEGAGTYVPQAPRVSRVSQEAREALEATFAADPDAADVLGGLTALTAQLAPVLGLAEATVTSRVRLAPRVVWLLPHTLAALRAGIIDPAQLMVVASETSTASVSVARRLDERVFGPGGIGLGEDGYPLNAVRLREQVIKALGVLDAEAVRARSRAKTAARQVVFTARGDGIGHLGLTGPAHVLKAAFERLTGTARRNRAEARQAAEQGRVAADGGDPYAVAGVDVADPGDAGDLDALLADGRTLNAHRFDAGVRALGSVVPADGSSAPQVTVELQVSLPTLLDAGIAAGGEDPGWVEGVGSVPAWLCRQAGSWRGAVVRRLLVDPFTGDLVTVDGQTYPASWLRRPPGGSPGGDPGGSPGGDPGGGSPGSDPGGGSDGSSGSSGGSGGSPGGAPGGSSGGGSGGDSSPFGPPGSGPGSGPRKGPDPDGDGGGTGDTAAPATFRGQPVQQLPAPRTFEDAFEDAFEPALSEEVLERLQQALAAGEVLGDPCADGLCVPVDPADCPLHGAGSAGGGIGGVGGVGGGVGGGPHDAPAALDRFVRALWGSCTGPGSTVGAGAADLDHVIAHRVDGSGGSTCACNLEPKGRFWHRVKHATDPGSDRNPEDPGGAGVAWVRRWRQWRCDRGCSHWVSPLGTRHHRAPRRVGQGEGPLRALFAPAYQVEVLPRLVYRGDTDTVVPDRPIF